MGWETLSERTAEETLSDNTQFKRYLQCKDCKKRDDGTVWSNSYDKTCCQEYPYPAFKPAGVSNNTEECPYREV